MAISRMLTVAVAGFDPSQTSYTEGVVYLHLVEDGESAVSGREKFSIIEKLGKSSDIVLINLSKPIQDYEILLLYAAYTNHTPIIGVGEPLDSRDILSGLISNIFPALEDAIRHITDNYVR